MAEDTGAGWFGKEGWSGRGTGMRPESSGLLVGRREEGTSAGVGKANGDVGKRLGRKQIYQARETTSNTFTLNWNDSALIYILTRKI